MVKSDYLADRFHLATTPKDVQANYNTAPGQIMPVVTQDEKGKRHLEQMKWGLIPGWSKDPRIGYKLINARAESIFDKPMWRNVVLRKRALIPASGFYEWKKEERADKPHKQPFYIHPKQIELFSFAGVWEVWHDAEGMEWKTYSIITTEPNNEMASIHDRMPVILHPEDEDAWLSLPAERGAIEPLLHPFEDGGLETYEVSDEVNSPKNNDAILMQPTHNLSNS